MVSTCFTPISSSLSIVTVSQQSNSRAFSPETSTPVLTPPSRIKRLVASCIIPIVLPHTIDVVN
ncbi:hypothetical protein ACFL1R_12765 [Candidatus Latescibacterota bacterium]